MLAQRATRLDMRGGIPEYSVRARSREGLTFYVLNQDVDKIILDVEILIFERSVSYFPNERRFSMQSSFEVNTEMTLS